MKIFLSLLTLLAFTSQVNAGWFSKDEPAAKETTKAAASGMAASATSLLPMLTSGLGVSEAQASGGMGSLLQLAQSSLSAGDFSTLTDSIPGASSLLSAAPEVADSASGLSSMMNSAGGSGDALSAATKVYSQFKELGLDTSMIPKYISVATEYLQSNGGQETVDLFKKGVSALM